MLFMGFHGGFASFEVRLEGEVWILFHVETREGSFVKYCSLVLSQGFSGASTQTCSLAVGIGVVMA
jgi:hypothetical protein